MDEDIIINHDEYTWFVNNKGICVNHECDDYYNMWDEVTWDELFQTAIHPKQKICEDSRIIYEFAKRGTINGNDLDSVFMYECGMFHNPFYLAFNKLAWDMGILGFRDSEEKPGTHDYFINEQFAPMVSIVESTVEQ